MAFRKLQYKNVQATRSTQVIGEGEVAIDPDSNGLFIGDGSTPGGVPIYHKKVFKSAEFTAEPGYSYVCTNAPYDVNLPASVSQGDWFEVAVTGGNQVAVQTTPQTLVASTTIDLFVYDGTDWIQFNQSAT